jgi:hypothetical protein
MRWRRVRMRRGPFSGEEVKELERAEEVVVVR